MLGSTVNPTIWTKGAGMKPYTRNVNRFIYLQTLGNHDNIFSVDFSFFAFLECRGSQECITLVKFNSTLWEDYELDIPESCIFPYWRNNKPANGNTQQTTHCSGKKTCKVSRFTKHNMHCWLNIWLIGTQSIWFAVPHWPAIWCQRPLSCFASNSWGFTLKQEIIKTEATKNHAWK